jgi:hypothetical protein
VFGYRGHTHTLWFDADTRNTIAVRNLQNNPVVISAEILALPDTIGFGNNYSLREAMVLDTTGTLKQAVIDFKNECLENKFAVAA